MLIGLDVGGTKLLGLLADEQGTVYGRARRPIATRGNQAIADQILSILQELVQQGTAIGGAVTGIAIGAPGYTNSATGVVIDATNIDVHHLPLGDIVMQAFGVPTLVVHDVKAAAFGEAQFGAGKGASHLAFLNVGTGISVGLIFDGQMYQGAAQRAGEIGHVPLCREGPRCACGRIGCLEALAAGPALARDARVAIRARRTSCMVALAGGRIDQITAETVAEAARRHDTLALEVLDAAADYVGQALASLITILDLDRVVVGGGVAQIGPPWLERVEAATKAYMIEAYAHEVTILPSVLRGDACALGAVAAFRHYHNQKS